MKISKTEEQSIRLVVTLARGRGQMTLPMLAAAEQLSEALVAKIMGQLRKGGIIKAVRGRTGGYELAHAPESLTVAGVIHALGKPILEGCASVGSDDAICPHIDNCSLRPIWEHLQEEISSTLDRITIAELLHREPGMRKHLAGLRAS
jgi:Rrf2 family protein